jgi:hypothetical protein
MAQCMAKPEDLALMLGITPDHLKQAFGGIISKAHAATRCKLLEVLKNQALHCKNERILIWLSKCWLGMSEPVNAEPNTVINISVAEIPALEAHATMALKQATTNAELALIDHSLDSEIVARRGVAD